MNKSVRLLLRQDGQNDERVVPVVEEYRVPDTLHSRYHRRVDQPQGADDQREGIRLAGET